MKLLHIDSSILGDASASRQLSRSLVQAWQAAEPNAQVSYRDLASDALSHPSAASLVAGGTPAELRDPMQGRARLNDLYALLHRGAEWKKGRKRPGGKQSKCQFVRLIAEPPVTQRARRNDAEFLLCTRLAAAYWKATGRMPPRDVNRNSPGPFARLLGQTLRLLGNPSVNSVKLARSYGQKLKKRVSPHKGG